MWTPACQQAFEAIKALLAQDAFLWYPDHNKCFDIYCDASDFQLGAAILRVLVAFYSHKLTSAQCNYTVSKKELLSVVPCYMDAPTYTSIQTTRTIRLPDFKHNMFAMATVPR
jgi:RNase H-like domain found in reverse transcriptase